MPISSTSHPAAPLITLRLRAKGPRTLGHETTLARAPMWAARPDDRPIQLALLSGPLVLHGVDFRQVEGAQLTVAEQRVVAELTTRYIAAGCPADRRVSITLTELGAVLGYADPSAGSALRAARRSLARIRSVTFSSVLHAGDHFPRIWGLIDGARPLGRGRPTTAGQHDAGTVSLNEELAGLVQGGHVTFLDLPTWDAIARADRYAGRLWSYLEAEQLPTAWNFSLFAAPPGGVDDQRHMPAIADLLLFDWPQRRQVAARITQACRLIEQQDPRYNLDVVKARQKGMWYLRARRDRRPHARDYGGFPSEVRTSWRAAFGPRQPSAPQRALLNELIERRGSTWIARHLQAGGSHGGADPLAEMLLADRELSTVQRRELDHSEASWQREKESEMASAPASLAAILEALASGRTGEENRTSSDEKPDFQ